MASNTSSYTYDSVTSHLIWTTDEISADSPTGSLEFTVDLPGDDVDAFYPVQVSFVSAQSLAGVAVGKAELVGGEQEGQEAEFSTETVLAVEQFEIV